MSEDIDFDTMSDEEFEEYANNNPIVDEVEEEDKTTVIEDTETEPEPAEEVEDTNKETSDTAQEEEVSVEDAQTVTEDTFNYKEEFSNLMAPIKANGREIQLKSIADARKLIQMGLNYDEKMVSIKPVRLAGKALERAGIIRDGVIDEYALNRMIDFNNGNIEVMKERLKELKIDPLDLDLDATNYQAQDHMVDEHSVVFDDIQRELDSRGTTTQVVEALNTMDQGSKDYFSNNPHQLLGLEQDIANGVFEEINENVRYERRMGRLHGKTDMEAYIDFARARGQMLKAQTEQAPAKKVNTEQRRRAGGTKPAVNKSSEVIDIFDMSDEEFNAQFGASIPLR